MIRKCLNDSDDEVRERAFFYLSVLGETDGISEEISKSVAESSAASSADTAAEMDDIKDFIFDSNQVIDVDALEAFVMEQKDQLVAEESSDFNIDLSSMMVSGKGALAGPGAAKAGASGSA